MLICAKNISNGPNASKKTNLGFSLIELMVAVVLFGILAALGLPSYSVWMENARIRNAAESIQTGLQKARVEALKRNANVAFVLGVNSAWTIECVNINADCPAVIESKLAGDGSSVNITITPDPPGTTTVVFNNLGGVLPSPPAALQPFNRLDIDSTKLSSSDSRDLRVRLIGGSVRMCDPYSGLPASDPRKC